MSERQWKRWEAIAAVNAGKLTMARAAQLVGWSEQQLRRLRKRIAAAGQVGLRHGNTGRAPSNKLQSGVREQIEQLGREKYEGFNDHHFRDKLEAREGIEGLRRMKREQRIDTPAGEGEGSIAGREIGAWLAALRLQPPAGELELDRLERLGAHVFAAAVSVGHNPLAIFQSVDLERLGQRFDQPQMAD
jgi:Winged helix-turn helix